MSNGPMQVDPAQQREFITALNKKIYNIGQMTAILESRLSLMGQTWTDQEYEVFRRKIAALQTVLAAFVEEGRRLSADLTQSATIAEDYQKIQE